ncbi:MAG: glycosyl hydrolase, partial [Bacteroidia bacterium]|nr:glycosyl hydrolase [Bacteroidia bacterium]
APGKYKARITVKGQSSETDLEIISDPHVNATAAEWAAQQEFLKHAGDQFEELHQSVNKMRQVKKQIETYNESLKDNANAKDIVNIGKELIKKLEKWENNLIEPRSKNFQDVINFQNKLNAEFLQLRGVADTHDPRLTKGVQERAQDVQADWNKYKTQLRDIETKDIGGYNQMFRDKNVPALITEKKETVINN